MWLLFCDSLMNQWSFCTKHKTQSPLLRYNYDSHMTMTQFNCHLIITHNTLSTNSSTHLFCFVHPFVCLNINRSLKYLSEHHRVMLLHLFIE